MHATRRLLLALLALLPAVLAAPAGAFVIAPGVRASFPYGGCTLNFVFDGTGPAAGRVFIGTAAHCTDAVGDPVSMGGDAVSFGEVVGRVAVRGPYERAEGNPSIDDDWALVEILPRFLGGVDPAVQGHPKFPTRVTATAEMQPGDVLQHSGHGVATSATQETREQRQGEWLSGDDAGYDAFSPLVSSGDSGGPLVDVKTGGALGILSTAWRAGCQLRCTLEGPTVSQLIRGAAAQGIPVRLRPVGPVPLIRDEPAPTPPPPGGEPRPADGGATAPVLRVAAVGRSCVRGGRLRVRLAAEEPLAWARLEARGRRPLVLRGRALRRPVALRGLRGARARLTVTARTRGGERLSARVAFPRC